MQSENTTVPPGIADNISNQNTDTRNNLEEQLEHCGNSNTHSDIMHKNELQQFHNQTIRNTAAATNQEENKFVFQKRPGTSGICGQLYETKLLSLILLRALNNNDIQEFLLATNMQDLGAMDDIVLRYKTLASTSKILFIQAKHRDDPNKDKLSLENILRPNEEFSFQKYLESYIQIGQLLRKGKTNQIFEDQENVECEFIIYTPMAENIKKKKILLSCDFEHLIKTTSKGKIFQLLCEDNDLDTLLVSVRQSRVTKLAKSVVRYIIKGNFRHVMNIEIIKEYHVFLSQSVLEIEDCVQMGVSCSNKENNYCNGKFKESFLRSSNENLKLLKQVICEELEDMLKSIQVRGHEVDSKLKALCFKLPMDFGNRDFRFYGSDKKQKSRLNHMCAIFTKLLQNSFTNDLNHKCVKIDETSVGPSGIILLKDLGPYWLGGLVGNLLIYDISTNMLQFNLYESCLSKDNIKILSCLKLQYDLSSYRFDINIYAFPKLTIQSVEHDKKIIRDFLGKLKFYTNQAKEDEVEKVIKNEIKYYHFQQNHSDSIPLFKVDLIFLKVHDEIQRWWKQPHLTPFLTESCQFYKEAERDVLISSLLNIINYVYRKEIETISLEYDKEAINALQLDEFLKSNNKVTIILSHEIQLTSKKLLQYFGAIEKNKDATFIDLDSMITKSSLECLKDDVKISTNSVLIITSQVQSDICDLCSILEQFMQLFKRKIIIVMSSILESDLRNVFSGVSFRNDNEISFQHLSSDVRSIIMNERKIVCQGVPITVSKVFNSTALDTLSSKLLRKLIYGEDIHIGESLTHGVYSKTIDFYAHRSLCRCITLKADNYGDIFTYITDETNTNLPCDSKSDIVVKTKSASIFEETCRSHGKANVHWFLQPADHAHIIWKESRGCLDTISKYVEKVVHKDFTIEVKTLNDIQERLVIVSAGPGMGKSTLLSHLAINTKRLHPNIWILKINLLDNIRQFSDWKEGRVIINLLEAIKFLYTLTFNDKDNKSEIFKGHFSEIIAINDNEVKFSDCYKKYLPDVDLSEIILLNHFYNSNSLAVLVDGFDEINPDYANEVMQLLCVLKNSKVAHLWVTSRPCNMLEKLELALGTFCFNLNSLTVSQQTIVLQNMWSKRLGYVVDHSSVNHFYGITVSTFQDNLGENFASLPLHLYMIAEVFENCFRNFLNKDVNLRLFRDTSNLITLYEKFTNIKFFYIRFGEKKSTVNLKDPDMRKIIDKERILFIKNHKMTAAYLLLDRRIVLSKHDIGTVRTFINNIIVSDEKSEIIECINDNHPKFVHYTFAEYFAVEHIIDVLRSPDASYTLWEYLIENLLINEQLTGIRRFINGKLAIDPHVFTDVVSTPAYSAVFNILLSQYDIKSPRKTAMCVAIYEKLDDIVMFLLKCVTPFLNKFNISEYLLTLRSARLCLFCNVIKSRKWFLLKCLVDIVVDIDENKLREVIYCQSTTTCDPLFLSLYLTDSIFGLSVLGDRLPDLLFEILTLSYPENTGESPAHSLGSNGYQIRYIDNYLESEKSERLVKIFSITDKNGQTPLHYAAVENDYTFMMKIYKLLGKEEFRKICVIPDKYGFTPVCMFSYDENKFSNLKALLTIIYDDPQIEVRDFVFNKLLSLHHINLELFNESGGELSVYFRTKRRINKPNYIPKTPIGLLVAFLGH